MCVLICEGEKEPQKEKSNLAAWYFLLASSAASVLMLAQLNVIAEACVLLIMFLGAEWYFNCPPACQMLWPGIGNESESYWFASSDAADNGTILDVWRRSKNWVSCP